MKSKVTTYLTAAVLAAFVGVGFVAADAGMKGRPTSVAVVDVEKAMNSLDEMSAIEAGMKVQLETVKQEQTERQNKLKQLQEDLNLLQPGSSAFKDKFNEFQLRAIELDSWFKFQQNNLNRERILQFGALYRKLTDHLQRVAAENGYDVIMFKEQEAPNFDNVKPEALATIIGMRKVLWARSDLDITDQIVLRMNNDYKNNR